MKPQTATTSARSVSTKAPLRPSSQAQKIAPKGKKPPSSKPTTAGGMAGSRSTKDLS